jgi:hypothetical protein
LSQLIDFIFEAQKKYSDIMRITEELLKSYSTDKCTSEEIKAVELWLSSEKYTIPDLSTSELAEVKSRTWSRLSPLLQEKETPVIPLYKTLSRYVAAACIVITVFFAGRYSSDNTIAMNTDTVSLQSNNLLVYGGNGACAKLQGNAFSLEFDGQLKLYNGSASVKKVKVGNVTYTLQPRQSYFLMGNNQKSSLIAGLDFEMEQGSGSFGELKGDFGIKVIKAA